MLPSISCKLCNSYFATAEIRRYHYGSEWHRFNMEQLSRNMPVITDVEYVERRKEISAFLAKKDESYLECDVTIYCNACRRRFSNQMSYDNHVSSRRHRNNVKKFKENTCNRDKKLITITKKASSSGDAKACDSGDFEHIKKPAENPLDVQDCLFCDHRALDMMGNFKHMSTVHSFFLPDADNCVNPEGVLDYLGKKIIVHNTCLGCKNGSRSFCSLDAVRKHMKDKSHCRILHKDVTLAEYADFYDYSSTDPDHVSSIQGFD